MLAEIGFTVILAVLFFGWQFWDLRRERAKALRNREAARE